MTFFSVITQAHAQELTNDFKRMVAERKLGPAIEQAFCYRKDGINEGYRQDKLQRIASVTKLFSTLLASETMDLHQKFITRIYIGKDSLHIEGGRDPYFEEDKFLLLTQALNNLGYKSFKKISFDKNFLFYDIAMGQYEKITPEKSRLRLGAYVNAKNEATIRAKWFAMRKFAEEEGVELTVGSPLLTVGQFVVSDVNPLREENILVYEHASKPFHFLLKTMNVQSKNFVAENVFESGSKIKPMAQLLTELDIDVNSFSIRNGSGLPIITGQQRFDNLSTCNTVMKVVEFLVNSVRKHNLYLTDIVAVNGGKDLGSFRDRFKDFPELNESVISKTGTLKHTSTLAGVLAFENAVIVPFAILNQTTNTGSARSFQDHFVAQMFDTLGKPDHVNYNKISIFPWDGSEFLTKSVKRRLY